VTSRRASRVSAMLYDVKRCLVTMEERQGAWGSIAGNFDRMLHLEVWTADDTDIEPEIEIDSELSDRAW